MILAKEGTPLPCEFKYPTSKAICGREAKYRIGWETGEAVRWIHVCGIHDNLVGCKNLQAAFGLTWNEATAMNRKFIAEEAG